MDHQTFDRLTRLFSASGSRRTAWRALLGAALLGVTTRAAAAAPATPCEKGAQESCGIGGPCCPGKCFLICSGLDEYAFCCSGRDPHTRGELIICGNRCCVKAAGNDPCTACEPPTNVDQFPKSGRPCLAAITGSYRRR
jgi:hypothetical protein